MVLNDQEINLVRRYFEQDLSEAELESLATRIEQDADFKKEVEKLGYVRKSIINIIKDNRQIDEKPNFTFLQKKSSNNHLIKLGILALFIIAALLIWNVAQKRMNANQNQNFAKIEQFAYSISSDVMRSNEEQNDIAVLNKTTQTQLTKIIAYYEAEDYTRAEDVILDQLKVAEDIQSQEVLHWWLINVYLKSDNQDALRNAIKSVVDHPDFNSSTRADNIYKELFR